MSSKIMSRLSTIVPVVVVLLYSLFTFFPLIWSLMTSFKTVLQAIAKPPVFFFTPTLENYEALFGYATLQGTSRFPIYLWNSIVVNVTAVVISLLIGLPMAYSLARFRLKPLKILGSQENMAIFILSMRMFPPIVILIPFYMLYQWLGIMDTMWGLVLFYQLFNLPLIIWLLRGYFKEVPREVEEAGMLDGATRFRAFFRHVFPLVLASTIATCLIAFSMSWNDFLVSTILTTVNSKTAPAYLGQMRGYTGILWTQLAAAGMLMTLPVVLLALIFRKYLVRVMSFGSIRR